MNYHKMLQHPVKTDIQHHSQITFHALHVLEIITSGTNTILINISSNKEYMYTICF